MSHHPHQASQTNFSAHDVQRAKPSGRPAEAVAILALILGLGIVLRCFSFQLESITLSRLAAVLLFAPASFATVALGWTIPLRLPSTLKILASFGLAFLAWNAVMLTGLSWDTATIALQQNLLHWGLFLLCGLVSLNIAHGSTGIGIWREPDANKLSRTDSRRLSVSKLLALTAAVAIGAETFRRLQLASFPGNTSGIWLSGILGGGLLGIQWSVLVWLWNQRAWRPAGLIVWIAIASIIRWNTETAIVRFSQWLIYFKQLAGWDDPYYGTIPAASSAVTFLPPTFDQALPCVLQATLQTALVLLGIRVLQAIGFPIRQLRKPV